MVERKHKHIVETILTLLAQSHLPLSFWWEAFHTTIYLINRMPAPTLANISPFQKLHNQIPNYQFTKVFGCSCFPLLKPYNQHKFDFHTQNSVFISYSPLYKNYKCLDKSGKVFIASHVTFNESKFPYTELFLDQSPFVMSISADQTPSQVTFLQSCTLVDSNREGSSTATPAAALFPTSSSHLVSSSSSSTTLFSFSPYPSFTSYDYQS